MGTVAVGVVTLVGGAFIGYLVRLTEFRRERRLVAYAQFIAAFLTAAHAGASLLSLYMALGEKVRDAEHRDESMRWVIAWTEAARAFEAASARLRLVGSDASCSDAVVIEDFVTVNIRHVPPLYRTEGIAGWGEAAMVGPGKVDSEAVRLARAFADRAHGEITGWRRQRNARSSMLA
jgi:hypothetical protein